MYSVDIIYYHFDKSEDLYYSEHQHHSTVWCVVRGVHSAEIRTSLKLCHQCKKRRIVFLVMRTGGLRNLCTFLLFENENGGDCFINPPNLKRKYFVIGSKEAQH